MTSQFRSLNDRILTATEKGFSTSEDIHGEEKTVKILFEETIFLDESKFVNVSALIL